MLSGNITTAVTQLSSPASQVREIVLSKIVANPTPAPWGVGDVVSNIDDSVLQQLAAAVRVNNSLERFSIGYFDSTINFTATIAGTRELSEALASNSNLRVLDLNFQTYSINVDVLLEFLRPIFNSTSIKYLTIKFYDPKFIPALSAALSANTNLEYIYLECCDVNRTEEHEEQILAEFAKALSNKQLKSLSINYLRLSDKAINNIADVLDKINWGALPVFS